MKKGSFSADNRCASDTSACCWKSQGIKSVLQCRIMDQESRGASLVSMNVGKPVLDAIRRFRRFQDSRYLFDEGKAQERLCRGDERIFAALEEAGLVLYSRYGDVAFSTPVKVQGGILRLKRRLLPAFLEPTRMCGGLSPSLLDSVRTSASSLVWNRNMNCYVHTRVPSQCCGRGKKEACMISCRIVEGLEKQRRIRT